METVTNVLSTAVSYMKTIDLGDAIDILIVAWLLYNGAAFIRKTNSRNVARAILLLVLLFILSYLFDLKMINFLLRKAMELGLIAIVILFQPELRRAMERVGSSFSSSRSSSSPALETAITQTVQACGDMSASRTGALIIFERKTDLSYIMDNGGTRLNADASAELIENIFFNKAPLHDGALIIREGRLAAAGCVLPLTESPNLSKELGMRHRAGIGMSEQSDAVVVIVSEETGAISCSIDGSLKRHLNTAALREVLHSSLIQEPEEVSTREKIAERIRSLLKRNQDEKA